MSKYKRLINANGEQIATPQNIMASNVSDAIAGLEVIQPENIISLEFRVLLKIADKARVSRGGIILSAAEIDKSLFADTTAEVINFGEECWRNSDGTPIANRPKVGDKVVIAKYAGLPMRDKDYNLFRFANDKDVVALIKGGK